MRIPRVLAALVGATMAAVTLAVPQRAAAETTAPTVAPDASAAAAGWLSAQLAANDDVLGDPVDWGLTADAVLGLAGAGIGAEQARATLQRLITDGTAYFGTSNEVGSKWAALAKVTLAWQVGGNDVSDAFGRDLASELVGALQPDGSWPGAIPFTQATGILALSGSPGGVPQAAAVWLEAQQCLSVGDSFGTWGWGEPCSSVDVDATAYAVQALLASGVPADAEQIQAAQGALETLQGADGGYQSSFGSVNSNTTALVAQTLRAVGTDTADTVRRAVDFVMKLQVTCQALSSDVAWTAADVGAFAYDASGWDGGEQYGIDETSHDQFERATVTALLAVGANRLDQLRLAEAADSAPLAQCSASSSGNRWVRIGVFGGVLVLIGLGVGLWWRRSLKRTS